jgi:hypothetical protein
MSHAKSVGRLSILAVGLGIGIGTAATAAAAPQVPVDPVPVVPDLPLAAGPTPGLDLSISYDGFNLFQSGTADAETGLGSGSIAVAFGDGSFASAGDVQDGGFLDAAWASGTNADAETSGGFFNTASANGTDSIVTATEGNYLSAFASGTDSQAFAEDGNFDHADTIGNDALSSVGGTGSNPSNWDYAAAVGANTDAESGAFGDFTGASGGDVATVLDLTGTVGSTAEAGNGIGNLSSVVGDGSTAFSGFDGSFNLAAALGDMLHAMATGGNFLVDIVP